MSQTARSLTLPSSSYIPGPFRGSADRQRNVVDAFLARRPEYARLPLDVLLQYAATYRDGKDHTLEESFRDNGVLGGCRIDYKRPQPGDRDEVPTSDDAFLGASYDRV